MKIAVNQPNYIPWLGYFDLIDTEELGTYVKGDEDKIL